jgi:hypothetical protein
MVLLPTPSDAEVMLASMRRQEVRIKKRRRIVKYLTLGVFILEIGLMARTNVEKVRSLDGTNC